MYSCCLRVFPLLKLPKVFIPLACEHAWWIVFLSCLVCTNVQLLLLSLFCFPYWKFPKILFLCRVSMRCEFHISLCSCLVYINVQLLLLSLFCFLIGIFRRYHSADVWAYAVKSISFFGRAWSTLMHNCCFFLCFVLLWCMSKLRSLSNLNPLYNIKAL